MWWQQSMFTNSNVLSGFKSSTDLFIGGPSGESGNNDLLSVRNCRLYALK
jgi:hypothetical protein